MAESHRSAIRLGPFELHEVVGRGGMGDVWRASHLTQGVDVALKVVTSSRAQNPRALAAFRNEVHAMARLDHPGIVVVFDVGVVSDEAAEVSAGVLRAQNPVLAMEYATHGTLMRVREGLHWRRLRAVTLSILDALAHAHARGVIHRDLKPGNVLVTNDPRGRPVLKLADFGLAQALYRPDDVGNERKISGTPRYMAPEQIEGRIRDQGPWTDLYALGCLAYWMLTGAPPFDGDLDAVLEGHLFETPAAIRSDIDLPPGFSDWVLRLLAKSPRDRFRCAADAAWGLMALDETPLDDLRGLPGGLAKEITDAVWSEPEIAAMDATVVVDTGAVTVVGSAASRPLDGYSATMVDLPVLIGNASDPSMPQAERAPLPHDWQRAQVRPKSMRVVGAGLGLYGLRPIPVVGRGKERAALWAAMREVHEQRVVRVVALQGAAGAGKSRLADWLCERATEVGGATVLRAFHGPDAGAADGLGRMLADYLRCVGLSHREVIERVRNAYFATGAVDGQDLYDARAIAEMIAPSRSASPDDVRFASPTERHVVVTRFLERVTAERPVVVWLDDVQWALDALDFLAFVLTTGRDIGLLFLLTNRPRTEATVEAVRLSQILADPKSSLIQIDRLEAAEHETLVGELLGLEPALAKQVAARTDGNPMFAVQLVGDWVQRRLLVVREDGFALADERKATLPDSIHDVWLERVEGFLAEQVDSAKARRQLELAAILGQDIDDSEWAEACRQLDDDGAPLERLVERLFQEGLAVHRPGGFAFQHGMLQESLVRVAQEHFRAPAYHRAAAAMLGARDSAERPDILERLGTHYYAAGDWQASLGPLLAAATTFGERCDFDRAKRLVALRDAALDAMGSAKADERRAQGWHVEIRCNLRAGLVEDAARLVDRGVAFARAESWAIAPEFELHVGSVARKRGETDAAIAGYEKALVAFEAAGNEVGVAKSLYGLGEIRLYRGDVEVAIGLLERSLAHMRTHDLAEAGVALTGLAAALVKVDRFDEARARLGDAVEAFRVLGNRGGRAAALNTLGELERARNELGPAEAAYREAVAVLESIGSRGRTIPRLNLALVYIARQKWSPALEELTAGLGELLAIGEKSHIGFVHLALCCAHAGLGAWTRYDDELEQACRLLEESNWVDRDIAHHAEVAAGLAHDAGERERAARAAALAEAQWSSLR